MSSKNVRSLTTATEIAGDRDRGRRDSLLFESSIGDFSHSNVLDLQQFMKSSLLLHAFEANQTIQARNLLPTSSLAMSGGNIVTSLDQTADMMRLMALAFDQAWDRFVVPGVPVEADKLRPILAQHIVEMVRRGERDLDRMSRGGVVRLREAAFGAQAPSRVSNRQLRRELRA